MSVEQLAVEAPISAARLTANTIKDVWSVMDAAAEKPAPSKLLSQKAIGAIQGVTDRAQQGILAVMDA